MRKLHIKALLLTMIMAVAGIFSFSSCSNDEEKEKDPRLTFIGDSEVARWDVKFFFPEYHVINKGVSGYGVADVEKMENAAEGTYAVVILGTNNIHSLTPETLSEYTDRYINTLEKLNGKRTFVFSIFPRSFDTDKPGMNEIIKQLNAMIKERCLAIPSFTYLDVYQALEKGDGINPEYSYDGLHLSKQGYELITWELKKKLR